MRTSLLTAFLFAAVTACAGSGSGTVQYSGTVETPQLVEVSPGVQVVADFDQPVFYSDNMYWRYDNGVWFQSRYHTRGWVRVDNVPVSIRTIDRPTAYIHYHAGADVRDHRAEAEHREQQVEQRHEEAAEARHEQQVEQRKDANERKEERKEDRKEAVEQRKEIKEQRKEGKEERKDAKEERKDAKKDRKDQ